MPRLPRIRTQVALATRHKVHGWSDGAHPSVHAGRSLDFHDVRAYVRGDDVADVDWRASARAGSLLVRRHVAERRATLVVAMATGVEMTALASPTDPRAEVALDVAATLGALALQTGDYTGMLWWAGGPRSARPTTRAVQVEQMLSMVEQSMTGGGAAPGLSDLLDATAAAARRPGLVAVVCGDDPFDADVESRLRRLSARHEVLVVMVPDLDPTDPAVSSSEVVGLDGRRLSRALRADPRLREEVAADRAQRRAQRAAVSSSLGIRLREVSRREDAVSAVLTMVGRSAHVA